MLLTSPRIPRTLLQSTAAESGCQPSRLPPAMMLQSSARNSLLSAGTRGPAPRVTNTVHSAAGATTAPARPPAPQCPSHQISSLPLLKLAQDSTGVNGRRSGQRDLPHRDPTALDMYQTAPAQGLGLSAQRETQLNRTFMYPERFSQSITGFSFLFLRSHSIKWPGNGTERRHQEECAASADQHAQESPCGTEAVPETAGASPEGKESRGWNTVSITENERVRTKGQIWMTINHLFTTSQNI